MQTMAPHRMTTLGGEAWFAALAALTASLGEDTFHRELVSTFGSLIPHSSSWIIRYARGAVPNVIFTRDVPVEVLAHYDANCSGLDPFSRHWALNEKPGVRTLRQFDDSDQGVDPTAYNAVFKPVANVSDELGVFFSTVGHASIGVFLERETGYFHESEIELARTVFPLLDGFYATHTGRLFAQLRRSRRACDGFPADRPMLIKDRRGLEILSTPAWRAAAEQDRSVLRATQEPDPERLTPLKSHVLKRETLSEYFPLAPGGTIFILLDQPPPETVRGGGGADSAAFERRLTAQEKIVFQLMMSGSSTGGIAQRLAISKRSVNNYRMKIYRKAGVHSERALVQKFGTAAALTGPS